MKQCIVCGAPLWETPLLTLDNIPASAQHMLDAQGVKEDRGLTLDLCQCMGCGLVQFDCRSVDYYRDVIRTDGFLKTMVEPRRYQCKHLIDNYHLEGKKFIEVGCGQGELLRVLSEFPVEVHGTEHGPHLVELTRAQGLDVVEGFTETKDTRFTGGLYDVFLPFGFLEHQSDPSTMLQTIYHNLEDDAMGLITAPGSEHIVDRNSYYGLIRGHLTYYTSEALTLLLECNGFQVERYEAANRDTLSVIVRRRPQVDTKNLLECYVGLKRKMETCMKYPDAWDKKVIIWGASHQDFTFVATTKLGEKVRYVIDPIPLRQGKFVPASYLSIVGSDHLHEHSVDAIIITAPGYTDKIAASICQKFGTAVEIGATRSNHPKMVQEE